MKLLPRISTNRNAASLMLALWLFTLASGLANACLLEDANHSAHLAAVELNEAPNVPIAPGHAQAAAHHHSEDSTQASCLKACDEVAQALQSHTAVDSINPGAAPLAAVLWNALSIASATHPGADAQPPLAEPPKRVRYSRWAL